MKILFKKRNAFGKKVAALRAGGDTPVICYGPGKKTEPCSVNTKDLLKLLASNEVVIETGGDVKEQQVILQDISLDPVSDEPMHADFLFVDESHEVEHEVPIRTRGESPGVKMHGGQMVVTLSDITVRALPGRIPGEIVIDVSALEEIGSRLLVSDIPLPEGVIVLTNPDEIVISIMERSQEEEGEANTDEDYLSNIEVTGKGGKKEEDPEGEEDTG